MVTTPKPMNSNDISSYPPETVGKTKEEDDAGIESLTISFRCRKRTNDQPTKRIPETDLTIFRQLQGLFWSKHTFHAWEVIAYSFRMCTVHQHNSLWHKKYAKKARIDIAHFFMNFLAASRSGSCRYMFNSIVLFTTSQAMSPLIGATTNNTTTFPATMTTWPLKWAWHLAFIECQLAISNNILVQVTTFNTGIQCNKKETLKQHKICGGIKIDKDEDSDNNSMAMQAFGIWYCWMVTTASTRYD